MRQAGPGERMRLFASAWTYIENYGLEMRGRHRLLAVPTSASPNALPHLKANNLCDAGENENQRTVADKQTRQFW